MGGWSLYLEFPQRGAEPCLESSMEGLVKDWVGGSGVDPKKKGP